MRVDDRCRAFIYTMLSGLYIIDGVDIWDTDKAAILKGSYNSLLAYPERRTPDFDDWFEEDYIDVDYSSLHYEASDVTIRVGIYGDSKADLLNKAQLFKNFLNKAGNRKFEISGINTIIELRYKGGGNATASKLLSGNQFYLEQDLLFSNDNPTQLLESNLLYSDALDEYMSELTLKPFDYMVWDNYEINNIPIIDFGMGVTSFNGSALVFDTLKEPLINQYSNKDGVTAYVLQPLKRQAKTLNIGVVMAHSNIVDLMNNYILLFGELSKKELLSFYSGTTDMKYCGYYLKQEGLSIYISPNLCVLEFNLEFTITEIRTINNYVVWSTEYNETIMTEDSINAIIYE